MVPPHPVAGRRRPDPPRPVGALTSFPAPAEPTCPGALTDGQHACVDFLRFFVDLWPSRWERLDAAVRAADRPAALDACLSVKSSAAMVGALLLSDVAAHLERAIRAADHARAAAMLPELGEVGERSMDAMRSWIRAEAGHPPD